MEAASRTTARTITAALTAAAGALLACGSLQPAAASAVAGPRTSPPAMRGPAATVLREPGSPTARPGSSSRGGAFDEDGCFTYVMKSSPARALKAFGGFPTERPISGESGFASGGSYVALATAPSGGTLIAESNGFECSRPVVLEAVSRGGSAVSVYWSGAGGNEFSYAVNGVVRFSFDLDDSLVDLRSAPYAALRPYLHGFPLVHGHLADLEAALALAERMSGIRVTSRDIDAMSTGRWHRVAPLLEPLRVRTPETVLRFAWRDDQAAAERIAAHLRAAPVSEQRQLAAATVTQALSRAGYGRDAEIAAFLPSLRSMKPRALTPHLELRVREAQAAREAEDMRHVSGSSGPPAARPFQQAHAWMALRAATNADAGLAVFDATEFSYWSLSYVRGLDVAHLLESIVGTAQ